MFAESIMGNSSNKVDVEMVEEVQPGDEDKSTGILCDPNADEAWGWLDFRPRCLQFLKSPKWFLLFICMFSLVQAMAVNSFVSIAIPTLERRYLFNSKQTGFLVSSNDITALLLVSFVSFYGGYGHKTKWLGTGAMLTGLGCVVFCLPHFLFGPYQQQGRNQTYSSGLCALNTTQQSQSSECIEKDSFSWYMVVFVCGQLLAGAGTTPLHTLGPAYLDENVKPKYSSLYLGAFFFTVMLGPGIGNMIGGKLLSIYVDIKLPADGLPLSPRDARWIGAWWLGPLVSGCLLFLVGVILLGFPKQLSGTKKKRDEAIAKGFLLKRDRTRGSISDIVPATKSLLSNGTYMFQNMAVTVSALVGAGLGPFLFKIIRIRYGGTTATIGIAVALILIPGAGGGIALGTAIVKLLGLKKAWSKAAKCSFFLQLVGIWTAFIFLIPGCNVSKFAGMDVAYNNRTPVGSLNGSCNTACNCSEYQYRPLCGPNSVNYFSPCTAGCTIMTANKTFTNCGCVAPDIGGRPSYLKLGICDRGCKNLIPFLIGAIVLSMISFSNTIPSKIVTIRSVPDNQRAYALGLQFVFLRTLGSLPGPILFGHLIDTTCTLWKSKCGVRGNCLNYDHDRLGTILMATALPINALSCLAYFLSWRFSKKIVRSSSDDPLSTNASTNHSSVRVEPVSEREQITLHTQRIGQST